MKSPFLFLLSIVWVAWVLGWVAVHPAAAEIDFQRDIRPILAEHCYQCHGVDAERRQAGLRLDERTGATGALPSGRRAIRPGSAGRSSLLSRIRAMDPELRMPPLPAESLSRAQMDMLQRWIEAGAVYSTHWAFKNPVRPALPTSKHRHWIRNPIDAFVLQRLQQQGMQPSPPAQRRQLLRRISLVTRGFPPQPKEMQGFDDDDMAIAKAIERWLASPHFGERMAQNWLDAARYADTAGHAADQPRTMWLYRDWVIDSINRDMPFDRFSVTQLAGDLLDNPSQDQLIATGFHRNSMQALGNNPRKEEFRVKGIVDRLETTGRVWLGLSLACAECHDHKYDPITTREYYQVFAIFNNVPHLGERFNVHGPRLEVELPQTRWAREMAEQGLAELARRRAAFVAQRAFQVRLRAALTAPQADQGDKLRSPLVGVPAVQDTNDDGLFDQAELDRVTTLVPPLPWYPEIPDQVRLQGPLTVSAWIKTDEPVGDLVSRYDWKAGQRSFVFGVGGERDKDARPGHLYAWLSEHAATFSGAIVYGSQRVDDGRWHHVGLAYNPGKSVQLFVDGHLDMQARVTGQVPATLADCDRRVVVGGGYDNSSRANAFSFRGKLAGLRIDDQAVNRLRTLGFLPMRDTLVAEVLAGFSEGRAIRRREAVLRERLASQQKTVTAQIMRELPAPRDTFIHIRGDYENRGAQVQPAVPGVLAGAGAGPVKNRLDFARWLVSGGHPLTARVAVNRIWQHYFGRGLVGTADDFGIRGAQPTHPELLDWLALEFVESGWSVKHIHRLILQSATFQQSSRVAPGKHVKDVDNRWLGRFPRRRGSAEVVRDTLLAISGLLDRRVGGRSVYPYQPEGVGEFRDATAGKWQEDEAPDCYRRGLYVFWQRTAPYPSMTLFDATSRERCTIQRSRTNTPLQALALLNDPVAVEMAKAFALRARLCSPEDDIVQTVETIFELALNRSPTENESERCTAFVEQALATGQDEETVWFHFAGAVLNLDETISIE
ncbi:MAG: DUF1553 domain-containing protein [Planctomycetota bacterium]|nr:DUF1553 domain-containing protein [Planctomycetota bacterium]